MILQKFSSYLNYLHPQPELNSAGVRLTNARVSGSCLKSEAEGVLEVEFKMQTYPGFPCMCELLDRTCDNQLAGSGCLLSGGIIPNKHRPIPTFPTSEACHR